jgi:ProP effector
LFSDVPDVPDVPAVRVTAGIGVLIDAQDAASNEEAAMSTVPPRKAIEMLAERFPKWRRKPSKVGIRNDLQATGVLPEEDLRAALRFYCSNSVYRSRLVTGAARIDLDGNPAGTVTAEQVCPPKKTKPKSGFGKPPAKPIAIAAPKSLTVSIKFSLADLRAAALARKGGVA